MNRMDVHYTSCLFLLLVAEGDFHNRTEIPCKANVEPGLKYRRVTWYQVGGRVESLAGLVLKDLHTNQTVLYKSAQHVYQIGEDFSLILPESAMADCATYRCTLWPPVGHRIQEGEYSFHPRGCHEAERFRIVTCPGYSDTLSPVVMGGVAAAVLLITLSAMVLYRSKCQLKM